MLRNPSSPAALIDGALLLSHWRWRVDECELSAHSKVQFVPHHAALGTCRPSRDSKSRLRVDQVAIVVVQVPLLVT